MDQFARIVLGYHGCNTPDSVEFARWLFDGTASVAEWQPSDNPYDWLGGGIYFWEHGPERARQWAGEDGSVIGAVIQLGRCFDLTDIRYTGLLRTAYDKVVNSYQQQGLELPKNEGRDWKLRKLDCLVVNALMTDMDRESVASGDEATRFQTVRCPFEEGEERRGSVPRFDAENANAHPNRSAGSELHSRSFPTKPLIGETNHDRTRIDRQSL